MSNIGPTCIMRNAYAVYPSLAMLAGMQLDLFTPLKDGPLSADALAEALVVQPARLAPLLYALVTAGLLTVEGDFFANTPEADKFLVRGRPEYLGGLGGFYGGLWQATLKTAESIRSGRPMAKLDWGALPHDQLVNYFKSQFPGSLRAGRQLAARLDLSRFKRLLDAGGGTGGLSIGICEKYTGLRASIADLPAVASIAGSFIAEAGMSDRIAAQPVDLINAHPEGSHDVAIVRALLQIMPPDNARKVLKNIARALEPGGAIFIIGSVLDDTRLAPPASIAFSLVFINVYDEGGSYTESEHRAWLLDAGFTDVSIQHGAMSDGLGIVSARKA